MPSCSFWPPTLTRNLKQLKLCNYFSQIYMYPHGINLFIHHRLMITVTSHACTQIKRLVSVVWRCLMKTTWAQNSFPHIKNTWENGVGRWWGGHSRFASCIFLFCCHEASGLSYIGSLGKGTMPGWAAEVRASKLAILMPRYLGGLEVVFIVLFLPSVHLTWHSSLQNSCLRHMDDMYSPSNVQSQKKGVHAANSDTPLDFSTGISILNLTMAIDWTFCHPFNI